MASNNEPYCDLNDMPKSWCAHCRNQDLPTPPPRDWFPARFGGRCAFCNKTIEVGDDIAATDDGYICRRRHDDD